MRDPKRIDTFCKRLGDAWKRVPDLRLIQLIENATGCNYYMEDGEAIKLIEQFIDRFAAADTDLEDNNEEYMGGF